MILYILTFTFLDSRREDRRLWIEWQQGFPEFCLLLISSHTSNIRSRNFVPFRKLNRFYWKTRDWLTLWTWALVEMLILIQSTNYKRIFGILFTRNRQSASAWGTLMQFTSLHAFCVGSVSTSSPSLSSQLMDTLLSLFMNKTTALIFP
jgi:hypothetical protein